ncbi:hypothetical protein TYRP_023740 [Tyrophagus putrescentiae]|nr:hypothetical protein TYRP_023740 [Tyrophagus putrescentiae]
MTSGGTGSRERTSGGTERTSWKLARAEGQDVGGRKSSKKKKKGFSPRTARENVNTTTRCQSVEAKRRRRRRRVVGAGAAVPPGRLAAVGRLVVVVSWTGTPRNFRFSDERTKCTEIFP